MRGISASGLWLSDFGLDWDLHEQDTYNSFPHLQSLTRPLFPSCLHTHTHTQTLSLHLTLSILLHHHFLITIFYLDPKAKKCRLLSLSLSLPSTTSSAVFSPPALSSSMSPAMAEAEA